MVGFIKHDSLVLTAQHFTSASVVFQRLLTACLFLAVELLFVYVRVTLLLTSQRWSNGAPD